MTLMWDCQNFTHKNDFVLLHGRTDIFRFYVRDVFIMYETCWGYDWFKILCRIIIQKQRVCIIFQDLMNTVQSSAFLPKTLVIPENVRWKYVIMGDENKNWMKRKNKTKKCIYKTGYEVDGHNGRFGASSDQILARPWAMWIMKKYTQNMKKIRI